MPSGQPGAASPTSAATTSAAASATSTPVATATDLPDIALGKSTYYVYESYMSPPQQPGDEADAPEPIAKAVGLEATMPGLPRDQRKSLGYGRIRFARDFAVDLRAERRAALGHAEAEVDPRPREGLRVRAADGVEHLLGDRVAVDVDHGLRHPVALAAERDHFEEAVVVARGAVEDPRAGVDPRALDDEIGEIGELVDGAVDGHRGVELVADHVRLEEGAEQRAGVDEVVAVEFLDRPQLLDDPAIGVARGEDAGADAEAGGVEEHGLGDGRALGRERVDFPGVEAGLAARGDHRDVARERLFAGLEPEAPALIVGGPGREHAERDVVVTAALEHVGGDLAERAVAAHGDRAAVIARIERGAHRGHRAPLRLGREDVAGDPGSTLKTSAKRPAMWRAMTKSGAAESSA